jgi:hypothetical protein
LANTYNWLGAAGRWFLDSGIQESNGGVARYYRTDLRQNAPISTEITGYAIHALLFFYERTGEAEYLNAALQAAKFLTLTAWNPRLATFPFEHSVNGSQSRALTYFFDCGIIVRGLLAAWRVSAEPDFRDTAIAAGRAMIKDFQGEGAIHPILELPVKRPLAYEPRWSAAPGCYQLKSAMAWQELFEATGEVEFSQAYEAAVESLIANHHDFLAGETNREKVMDRLHAYAYFLEGLTPVLNRPDCARIYREGVERAAGYLLEIAPLFTRSDVFAQLLRVRLLGEALGVMPLDHATAAQYAAEAEVFQASSADTRVAGGFLFGRKCGEAMPFVNPVSTAFCAQALAWWDDRKNSALQVRRQLLI